ncbi:tetratricopeptide repeat protein [Nocardia sp. CA2R105]|uniref:ATP-binding protein n=1 Tax=Nocardia coffeae TaxID=2873381 RepID=UPI001CA7398E|nr:tetratricopeptide repeat protein [Nocardia coffeae]MBY8863896.1 tetratricopeptide repeat protein [Nocardia coffeae]
MTAGEDGQFGRGQGGTRSDLSGSAADVVQARDIAGGVHFHSPSRDRPAGESVPVPAQLPAAVHGFVNRVADLDRLDSVLEQKAGSPGAGRVCVLIGTAGVGKTSLAVHWGHRVRDRFPDGQLYVNLRGYDTGEPITPGQALERFLLALGVAPGSLPLDLETRAALFRTLLAQRRTLIVLDNAATVKQVRPLLPGAGRCLVLITSRSRLSSLVARDGAHRVHLQLFDEPAAIELLAGTVAGYRRGDSEHDIAELARLCARLPLALRVAAERAAVRPHMPMSELIENLHDESRLWSALSAEDGEEADAVRTVFAWSYRALPPEAARLFRLLGLHPGPEFSTHAAAALTARSVRDTSNLLDVLVGVHLLEQIGRDRYQFHDLLRAYATDRVRHQDTAQDRHAAITRVLAWYMHTLDNWEKEFPIPETESTVRHIASAEPPPDIEPLTFADPDTSLAWFDIERANLTACVRVAVETGNDRIAWRIPAFLARPYSAFNTFDDWFSTTELGLEAARRLNDTVAQAILLESLTMAYRQVHHLDKAEATGREALALYRRTGHPRGEAIILNLLALINGLARRPDLAHAYLQEAETLSSANNYRDLLAVVTTNRSWVYLSADQHQEAYDHAISTLDMIRSHESAPSEYAHLVNLMRAAHGLGHFDEAAHWAQTALPMARTKLWEGYILIAYGNIQRDRGDLNSALATYQRSAVIHRQLGDRNREAETLDATGTAYMLLGQPEQAVRCHFEAIELYRSVDSTWGMAVALDHLARASTDLHTHADATRYWHEALTLISEFDDPGATALRDSIGVSLQQAALAKRPPPQQDPA